jgi:hypothetical protein
LRILPQLTLAIAAVLAAASQAHAQQPPPANRPALLKIVVIAGEDAVNVVQQKTAVAPIVEVRDRNDQPIAGIAVRFAIRNGRASFNGARALTVTTNAAGRAAATGLTPTGTGALQIGASVTLQGQTAVATIVQTNVLTAAEASAAAGAAGGTGAGGSAGGAGAGGAGSSGGLSATTLGIVGGAVAGGTLVAREVVGEEVTYTGPFTIVTTITRVFTDPPLPGCTLTTTLTGTVTIVAEDHGGTLGASIDLAWNEAQRFVSGGSCAENTGSGMSGTDFESPASAIHADWTDTSQVTGDPPGVVSRHFDFSGMLNGDTIDGTIGISFSFTSTRGARNAGGQESFPLTTVPVILRRQ